MPITETLVSFDTANMRLEVKFTSDSKSYDWGEQVLATIIRSNPDVAEIDVSVVRSKRASVCTVRATPTRGVKFRTLSIAVREAVADHCNCDLGRITHTETYDRIAMRELTPPQVAPASDAGIFDEPMPPSR